MTDCELTFKCGKYDLRQCLEKSFLHNDTFPQTFESKSINETKEYMKKI